MLEFIDQLQQDSLAIYMYIPTFDLNSTFIHTSFKYTHIYNEHMHMNINIFKFVFISSKPLYCYVMYET